jgi:L-ascorbate metabolism protein UlaG (beta-lactamase superfamily)
MTRRRFIKKILTWGKMLTISSLLSSGADLNISHSAQKGGRMTAKWQGLSLKEMALKKIHHEGKHFRSPFIDTVPGSIWSVLKWKLFAKNHFKMQYQKEQVTPVSIDWKPVKQGKGLSITFLNHASVMIKDIDTYFLVDPIFFGLNFFIKDFTPLTHVAKEMPRPDHVLITHGHYDHLDKPTLASLRKDTHLISPLGYNDIFDDLSMKNRTHLDWFDSFQQGKREITLLPCQHWTMRNPITGPNRSLWGSYLIKTASGPTIYVSGDTAYFKGFREIGKAFSIDLAIINLSAYAPRWFMKDQHINPAETVRAFKELGAKHLIIVHWGTFRLGNDPVYLPPIELRRELETAGLADRYIPLNHGETCFYRS